MTDEQTAMRDLARAFREARVFCRPKFTPLEWSLTELVLLRSLSVSQPRATMPEWSQLLALESPGRLQSCLDKLSSQFILTELAEDRTLAVLSPTMWLGRTLLASVPAGQMHLPAARDSSLSHAKGDVALDLHRASAVHAPCLRIAPKPAVSEALAFVPQRIEAKAIAGPHPCLTPPSPPGRLPLADQLLAAIGPRALHHPNYAGEWEDWLSRKPNAVAYALAEFAAAQERARVDSTGRTQPVGNAAGYVARIVRRYP